MSPLLSILSNAIGRFALDKSRIVLRNPYLHLSASQRSSSNLHYRPMMTSPPGYSDVRVALVQLRPGTPDREQNSRHMRDMVLRAVREGEMEDRPVQMVVLPELWNTPIDVKWYDKMKEPVPEAGTPLETFPEGAHTSMQMSQIAAEANVWLLGGSIPEIDGDKLRNCCTVWDNKGNLVKVYRKLHLFDLCLPQVTYQESARFNPGQDLGIFQTPFGKFAVGICYDMRFPELATIAARNGCSAFFYPAAFTVHTGKLHWELLQRARALDNQIYVLSCSAARNTTTSFPVYGYSMAVSPMGEVVASAQEEESIIHATIDSQVISDTRAGIPLSTQRRFDIYPDISSLVKLS